MASRHVDTSKLLTIALFAIRFAVAQLTGSITSPDSAFIVSVEITNPSPNTVSILAWNNIFDNKTQLPVFFAVKDDQGNELQLASTYAMRAGMSSADLFALAPGQSYTKLIDLRQILQNAPNGSRGAKLIEIYLEPSFKGFIGAFNIDVEASAELTNHPPSLGNFAAANLQDISLEAHPLSLGLFFPLIQELDASFISSADGIHVSSRCAAQNLSDSQDALFDAGIYANSLSMAANNTSSELYPFFFPAASRLVVTQIANAVARSIDGEGPHVDVICTDLQSLCSDPNMLGYSFTPSYLSNAYVVLCPPALALGRAPQPCDTQDPRTQRSASASHVMFHLILTLNSVVGTVMASSAYGTLACERLSSSTLFSPTKNPDSFAQLAIAHWAYGLGGQPYTGSPCLPSGDILPGMQKRTVSTRTTRPALPTKQSAKDVSPQRRSIRNGLHPDLGTEDCTAAELTLLKDAVANAQNLANISSQDLLSSLPASADRWKTFFNGDSTVKSQVRRAYDAVSEWNTTAPYIPNSFFQCDPTRQSLCQGDAGIRVVDYYNRLGYHAYILACPEFFYYPVSLECLNPGPKTFTRDQGGLMLHELLHLKSVVKAKTEILDGDPSCYEWNCLIQYAHDRVLPTWPTVNLPENVASSYEYFAKSVRAAKADCSWVEYAGHLFGSAWSLNKFRTGGGK